jgi:hypothetical protein
MVAIEEARKVLGLQGTYWIGLISHYRYSGRSGYPGVDEPD